MNGRLVWADGENGESSDSVGLQRCTVHGTLDQLLWFAIWLDAQNRLVDCGETNTPMSRPTFTIWSVT